MRSIRAGSGLGDSIYLQSIVRHFQERGEQLVVRSDFPEVFSQMGAAVMPFSRLGVDIVAHYTTRKNKTGTDQFEDMCINAGIRGPVDLRLDWKPKNRDLVRRIQASGKPVVCVQLARAPMGRTDGFGKELLPDCRVIQRAIDEVRDEAFVVQVGAGESLFRFGGIDLDLSNRTTVSDLLDVASVAQALMGYVSYIVPLAESFRKPALLVWSHRGFTAPQLFIRTIRPEKILHRDTSLHVVDNWGAGRIAHVFDEFKRVAGCARRREPAGMVLNAVH